MGEVSSISLHIVSHSTLLYVDKSNQFFLFFLSSMNANRDAPQQSGGWGSNSPSNNGPGWNSAQGNQGNQQNQMGPGPIGAPTQRNAQPPPPQALNPQSEGQVALKCRKYNE